VKIGEILSRLDCVRSSPHGWIAQCPAHEDRSPSLSIREEGGKILFHCHAGCSVESVCAAADIEVHNLFSNNVQSVKARPNPIPPDPVSASESTKGDSRRIVAEYNYVDEAGKLLYQNVRFDPKDFMQRRPDGKGGWIPNLGNVRRVPYNLPKVLSADSILLVEGEKDCETARGLGMVATNSKNWRLEFAEHLHGKQVAIIADADEPGRKTANEAAQRLAGKVSSLKLVEIPGSSKDLTDWVAGGGTYDALLNFIELQPEWSPGANWRELFHTAVDFENAPLLSFAIKDFLPNDAATVIGGLAGHDKTWILLSITKALLKGTRDNLWDYFVVLRTAQRVVYLIPESAIGPFGHRLKLMGLLEYVKDDRLFVRTLSKGPRPSLSDPRILAAVNDAYVMLDTLARFTEGDENSAAEFQSLANDIFGLLGAGAHAVVAAHHSPKAFAKENVMSLESMLRGSGDIGAIFAAGWGVKQIDKERNLLHIENLKARDFDPCEPFQLVGRPCIDETGDFGMHRRPGECGHLQDEQDDPRCPGKNRSGASTDSRDAKAAKMALLSRFYRENPNATWKEIVSKFKQVGVTIARGTIRKYRSEMGL
jgi:hypothetical protein